MPYKRILICDVCGKEIDPEEGFHIKAEFQRSSNKRGDLGVSTWNERLDVCSVCTGLLSDVFLGVIAILGEFKKDDAERSEELRVRALKKIGKRFDAVARELY